jgi:hypothetical protein
MRRLCAALASAAWLLSACMQAPRAPVAADPTTRPAERALLAGLKAYDDAQYESAENHFRSALGSGLAAPKDRAEAHKRLAFLYCAAARLPECEAEFRRARASDASFALDAAEAGHPVWGPVYRRMASP